MILTFSDKSQLHDMISRLKYRHERCNDNSGVINHVNQLVNLTHEVEFAIKKLEKMIEESELVSK